MIRPQFEQRLQALREALQAGEPRRPSRDRFEQVGFELTQQIRLARQLLARAVNDEEIKAARAVVMELERRRRRLAGGTSLARQVARHRQRRK